MPGVGKASLLEFRNVKKRFGGIVAVDECSFKVSGGSAVGIIGPNGSGKTTLLNLVNGVYKPDYGSILFEGKIINGLPPSSIASLGISRTFQICHIFKKLTVLENLLAPTVYAKLPRAKILERANKFLSFFDLEGLKDYYAVELSGGQQRLLEIARALMTDPKLLLLDEPFAGIHPDMLQKVTKLLRELKKQCKSAIVVSHEIKPIMEICDKVIVMSSGKIICEGSPDKVASDKRVIEAYLGGA